MNENVSQSFPTIVGMFQIDVSHIYDVYFWYKLIFVLKVVYKLLFALQCLCNVKIVLLFSSVTTKRQNIIYREMQKQLQSSFEQVDAKWLQRHWQVPKGVREQHECKKYIEIQKDDRNEKGLQREKMSTK